MAEKALVSRYKNNPTRRGITGCEVARYLLDMAGSPEIPVDFHSPGRQREMPIKHLLLDKKIYEGSMLFAAAEAARQSVLLIRRGMNADYQTRFWDFLGAPLPFAWIAFILSYTGRGLHFLRVFSGSVFLGIVVLAVFDLPAQWELSRQAFELLKSAGQFEVDELIKLKKILQGLRLNRVASLFDFPLTLFPGKVS